MTGAATAPVLEAIDVVKRYGPRTALAGVSLAVRPGEIVGLLGPNGAGKTTTLPILATVLRPDAGRVLIRGRAPDRRLRAALGVVPQALALYPTLTVAQNVWHFARMQGLARADARAACARVLAEVGLEARARDPVRVLSGGMQRRLNLACGLVHRPAVLLLDEPTVGVDVESRERLLAVARRVRDHGAAVVYSTHYMEEAERICDRVLLIDGGRLIANGTVEELIVLAGGRTTLELTYRGRLPAGWDHAVAGVRPLGAAATDGTLALELTSHAQVGEILERVQRAHARVVDFSLRSANLADAFVALTGRSLRDPAAL
jgi:ABC-2 type transport system ATP-binding protein